MLWVIFRRLCHHMVLLKIFLNMRLQSLLVKLQLHDLQQDLAINAGSLHVHAITAGSQTGQIRTPCFGTLSPCEDMCTAAHDLKPFCTGAATETCATAHCQVMEADGRFTAT